MCGQILAKHERINSERIDLENFSEAQMENLPEGLLIYLLSIDYFSKYN